jgi:hypothetical protein
VTWGAFFYPHTVEVRDYIPGAGMGPSFGAARTLAAEVLDEQRLVRGTDGEEVVSSTQVTVALSANVPVGSRVTVWPGGAGKRTSKVLAVARNENAAPLDSYLVLSLE